MWGSAVFLIEKDERSRDTTDRSYIDSLKRTCICPTFKTVKKNPPYFCTDKNIPIVQLFFCCYVGFLFNFNDALNYIVINFFCSFHVGRCLFFIHRTQCCGAGADLKFDLEPIFLGRLQLHFLASEKRNDL